MSGRPSSLLSPDRSLHVVERSLPQTLLALIDDLFFSVQVSDTAASLGYEVVVAHTPGDFARHLQETPDLVLVDMGVKNTDWARLIREAKATDRPVIAFGDHTDLEARQLALNAGATAVVANSVVARDLGGLLRKHGKPSSPLA